MQWGGVQREATLGSRLADGVRFAFEGQPILRLQADLHFIEAAAFRLQVFLRRGPEVYHLDKRYMPVYLPLPYTAYIPHSKSNSYSGQA